MDDRLRLIRYLYGEETDESALARRLSEDDDLYREYERLRATKQALDDRPARQPDPAVVDQVVSDARTAAESTPSPAPSTDDRPARAPSRTWTRRLQAASAAVAVALLVGLGWWQVPGASDDPTAGPVESRALNESAPQAPTTAESQAADGERIPAWDEGDDLVRIQRSIERLQAHSTPDRWGSLQRVSQNRP